jgi:hypothetical protein
MDCRSNPCPAVVGIAFRHTLGFQKAAGVAGASIGPAARVRDAVIFLLGYRKHLLRLTCSQAGRTIAVACIGI